MRIVLIAPFLLFPVLAHGVGGDLTLSFANGGTGAYSPTTGVGNLDVVVHFGAETPPFGSIPCSGFSIALASDPSLISPLSADPVGVLAAINGGAGPDFFSTELFADGIAVGCVTDLQGISSLQFPPESPVVAIAYSVDGPSLVGNEAGVTTQLTWQTIGTSPPHANFVLYGDGYATLVLANGLFPLLPGTPFRRGDVNGDSATDIGDVVCILGFLFQDAHVDCPLSVDTNDDDATNIGDAVYLLATLFTGGAPPPPPFGDCGFDTGSTLACQHSPCP